MMLRPPRKRVFHIFDHQKFRFRVLLDCIVKVSCVKQRHADIAIAMIDQDWDVCFVCVLYRVHAFHGSSLKCALNAIIAPIAADPPQIRNASPRDRAFEWAIFANRGRHGSKPTIRVSKNSNPRWISDPVFHEPSRRIILVILH